LRRLLSADRMSESRELFRRRQKKGRESQPKPRLEKKDTKKGEQGRGRRRKRLRASERGRRKFRAGRRLPDTIEYEPSSDWAPDAVLHASIREHAKEMWASLLRAD